MTSKQRWQFGVLCCIEAAADTLMRESKQISDATRIKLQQVVAKCSRMKDDQGALSNADAAHILAMHDRVCKALHVGDRVVDSLEWLYGSASMAADEADRLRGLRPDLAEGFSFLEGMVTEAIKDYDPNFEANDQMDYGLELAKEIKCAML